MTGGPSGVLRLIRSTRSRTLIPNTFTMATSVLSSQLLVDLSKRSPDERSDIRFFSFPVVPAYRCAHAGYLLNRSSHNA
jgi:hypothetical protein